MDPRYQQGVTRIEDLPTVDELENGHMGHGSGLHPQSGLPPNMQQKYSNVIRAPMRMNPNAGMQPMNEQIHPEHLQQVMGEQNASPPQQPFINCIEIVEHINNCPICSRFYKNDNTMYMIVIVVLVVICLLLLKRVLNV